MYPDQIFSFRPRTEGRGSKAKKIRYEPSIDQSFCRPSLIRSLIYDFLSTHLGVDSYLKLALIGFVFLLAENTFIFILPYYIVTYNILAFRKLGLFCINGSFYKGAKAQSHKGKEISI
jgi:hypothetical protein